MTNNQMTLFKTQLVARTREQMIEYADALMGHYNTEVTSDLVDSILAEAPDAREAVEALDAIHEWQMHKRRTLPRHSVRGPSDSDFSQVVGAIATIRTVSNRGPEFWQVTP